MRTLTLFTLLFVVSYSYAQDKAKIEKLLKRAKEQGVLEVIIATNATLEGQTTAHYISQNLQELNIKVTRLAHGIPLGGELDYMDEGTISTALQARKAM
jgi:recombination protein RecR